MRSPKFLHARVWALICHAVDEDFSQLTTCSNLDWMPAHQTPAAIGNRHLASGRELRALD
jgi:hypothetical protein